MSGPQYKISLDLGKQMELAGAITAAVLPHLSQAIQTMAKHTAVRWQQAVYEAKLWSGEKDAYAESISWRMTGDFSAVVETDYKHATDIETGRPPRDLKRMLNTSMKVRRSASTGNRFLVIPFRHNTPGNNAHSQAMPDSVYGMAKEMAASTSKNAGRRLSGEVTMLSPKTGMAALPSNHQTPFLSNPSTKGAATVAKRSYSWGGRITAGMLKQAGMDAAAIKRYSGMVRMDTRTPGGSKSSAYLNFRIMSEGSSGWIVPAQPGQYIAKKVADEMQNKAKDVLAAAITYTVKS